jgi:hypothetical protein
MGEGRPAFIVKGCKVLGLLDLEKMQALWFFKISEITCPVMQHLTS